MSESIALKMGKRAEQVKLILAKANVPDTAKLQVEAVVDYSGSMRHLYSNNTVQTTLERAAAVALRFDDNGALGVTAFSTKVGTITDLTMQNIEGYVNRVFTPESGKVPGLIDGGTRYSLPIKTVIDKHTERKTNRVEQAASGLFGGIKSFFGKKDVVETTTTEISAGEPVFTLFITDGETIGDRDEVEQLLTNSPANDMYWLFVGIEPNRSYFRFVEELADKLPNVGFVWVPDVANTTDEELFNSMLTPEVLTWIKRVTAKGN